MLRGTYNLLCAFIPKGQQAFGFWVYFVMLDIKHGRYICLCIYSTITLCIEQSGQDATMFVFPCYGVQDTEYKIPSTRYPARR